MTRRRNFVKLYAWLMSYRDVPSPTAPSPAGKPMQMQMHSNSVCDSRRRSAQPSIDVLIESTAQNTGVEAQARGLSLCNDPSAGSPRIC